MPKLTKSCRTLRELESRIRLNEPRSAEYVEALEYRRALYAEFGSKAVIEALSSTKDRLKSP